MPLEVAVKLLSTITSGIRTALQALCQLEGHVYHVFAYHAVPSANVYHKSGEEIDVVEDIHELTY